MSDTKLPLISVIIPTHNNGTTLHTAIESMLSQTYPNIEVIVVSDNSTDNTAEVGKRYAAADARVRYFDLPFSDPNRINKRGRNINAGYSARNYALDQARGEWITFQDGDDASLANRIEVQYKLALEYNSSHVSVQWQAYRDDLLNKKLDVERIFKEKSDVVISTQKILEATRRSKGPAVGLLGPLNEHIPFEWKRLRIINKLFFGTLEPFPGSGNCPLVKRSVFDTVRFNPLHKRIWPSFMGRGADRDFNFRVAETFRDSISFNLPLYLWRMDRENPDFIGYETYII
jgi:glycosyltransferase involved in cell wall biosynthesis